MTSNQISPEAVARREAARQGGRFGTQAHSAPDADVLGGHVPLTLETATLAEAADGTWLHRQDGGLWTDKFGNEFDDDQATRMGSAPVAADVDDPADGFEDLGAGAGRLGDISLGREFGNRKTWQLPDGSFARIDVTYGVVAVPAEQQDWQGMAFHPDDPVTGETVRLVADLVDEHRHKAMYADNAGDDADARQVVRTSPVLHTQVHREVNRLHFTDLDDPAGSALSDTFTTDAPSEDLVVSFRPVGQGAGSAFTDAEAIAEAEQWAKRRCEREFIAQRHDPRDVITAQEEA